MTVENDREAVYETKKNPAADRRIIIIHVH
jgi:hypothetical protein